MTTHNRAMYWSRFVLYLVVSVLLAALRLSVAAEALPADCADVEPAGDTAGFDTVIMYPSLSPRTYIRAGYSATAQMERAVFNPSRPDTWVFVRDKDGTQLNPSRVELNTRSFVAHLFLPPNEPAPATYMLYVKITRAGKVICRQYSAKIEVDKKDPYTLKLDPAFAPAASRSKDSTGKNHIPPDLVVNLQLTDIAEVIL